MPEIWGKSQSQLEPKSSIFTNRKLYLYKPLFLKVHWLYKHFNFWLFTKMQFFNKNAIVTSVVFPLFRQLLFIYMYVYLSVWEPCARWKLSITKSLWINFSSDTEAYCFAGICETWNARDALLQRLILKSSSASSVLNRLDIGRAMSSGYTFQASDIVDGAYVFTVQLSKATQNITGVEGSVKNALSVQYYVEQYKQVSVNSGNGVITHVVTKEYQPISTVHNGVSVVRARRVWLCGSHLYQSNCRQIREFMSLPEFCILCTFI